MNQDALYTLSIRVLTILENYTVESLTEGIHVAEHIAFPKALRLVESRVAIFHRL